MFSPAELSYLHTSLSFSPPIRPDSRSATQFRPLIAETDILPGTNGSGRICFPDGTEAIVGVKAEVDRDASERAMVMDRDGDADEGKEEEDEDDEERGQSQRKKRKTKMNKGMNSEFKRGMGTGMGMGKGKGEKSWVELTIDMPGFRDDDPLPIFLAAMLNEALLASGELPDRLWINARYHWRLFIDVRSRLIQNDYIYFSFIFSFQLITLLIWIKTGGEQEKEDISFHSPFCL